ncbi:hypothetical protein [Ahrensia sp. 13_GOM-1096m]|uniref:hypothetical protein n=1 Tax=Ahrensia sp. 13_GOM-1096m TaxID=1380380 RepID=UPI000479FD4F|nr:hypothetical protein [Ahrensia sp. 13_GOM-1096m]
MSTENRRYLMRLIAGFTVWTLGFITLYGLQSLGCAYEWYAQRTILIGTYIVILMPLIWLALRPHEFKNHQEKVLSISALWANRAALASAILIFFPITFASTCI